MPDIPNPDITIPAAVIGFCFFLMALAWFFTRPKPSVWDLPQNEPAAVTAGAFTQQITVNDLGSWHETHGHTVQKWIENHENVLKLVSGNGLTIDLNNDLTSRHAELAPRIEAAVASHPAPDMRAQLSALVVASRSTIDALKRSDWGVAERQHVTYLSYRDQWLHRLRQFSSGDTEISKLRSIADTRSTAQDFRPTA